MTDPSPGPVLVDGHVHLYPNCDPHRLFHCAAANFDRAARRLGAGAWTGVLCLADRPGDGGFERLARLRPAGWEPAATGETRSLMFRDAAGRRVLVIAGLQLHSAEGLEVLALGLRGPLPDRAPLDALAAAVRAAGGIPVIAWGLGKWTGRRGRRLETWLPRAPRPLWLGDNGGRPRGLPAPRLFALARRHGVGILPGSDPFPFDHDLDRVGAFGARPPLALPAVRPGAALLKALGEAAVPWPPYGRRAGPVRCLRNQVLLRWRGVPPAGPVPRERPDIVTASADYARRFRGRAGAYLLAVQEEAVAALLPKQGGVVLELGGGHGQLTELLRRRGCRVIQYGSDNRCHRRVRERHGDAVDCITGDLVALPLAERSVDVVLGVRLMAHVGAWRALLAEACRVARQAVIIDYPSLCGPNLLSPLLFRVKKGIEGNTRSYQNFFQYEIAREFARHGFRVTGRRPQFLLPMGLHRLGGGAAALAGLEAVARRLGLTRWLGSPVILRAERVAARAETGTAHRAKDGPAARPQRRRA